MFHVITLEWQRWLVYMETINTPTLIQDLHGNFIIKAHEVVWKKVAELQYFLYQAFLPGARGG